MAARHRPGPIRSDRCDRGRRDRAAPAARRPSVSARRDAARAPAEGAIPPLRVERTLVEQLLPNPPDHLLQARATLEVREDEWSLTAHHPGVAGHDVEARADVRGKVDLVDHEEIRTGHARTAFTRDLVASGDVDDIDGSVHELGAEAGRQIVAARLEKHDLQIRVPFGQLVERVEVHRCVFPNGGVRASPRLHADDAIASQRLAADQKFHVLAREDIVGDDAEPVTVAHRLAEGIHERRLSGTDRSTDADAHRALAHERNNLECRYCCVMDETSIAGVKDLGRVRVVMASTTIGTRWRVLARRACASVWPIRIKRSAADVVDASRVYANAAPASRIPTPAEAHAQPNAMGRAGPSHCPRARSSRWSSRRSG